MLGGCWGDAGGRAGRVFQRLLCSLLLQVNAANLQVGPQDLAAPSRLPGKVSKHHRPRPPGLAVPSSWNPPGQRGSGGPSAGPLARQRPQASLASSTDGTVPAPTTASPCPAPAQHPSPPANTPQDKAPNQCSFLAPSTSPRPCHPGCALSTFILLAPSSPPRLGVPSGPRHGEGYGPG